MSFGHFAKEFCENNKEILSIVDSLRDYLLENNDVSTIYFELVDCLERSEYHKVNNLIGRLENIKKSNYKSPALTESELFDKQVLDQIINHCTAKFQFKKLSDIWD